MHASRRLLEVGHLQIGQRLVKSERVSERAKHDRTTNIDLRLASSDNGISDHMLLDGRKHERRVVRASLAPSIFPMPDGNEKMIGDCLDVCVSMCMLTDY